MSADMQEEKLPLEKSESVPGAGGQKGRAKKSALKLAKEFSSSQKFSVPRAVFMLMIFCFLAAFFSSMMTGLALSLSSVFVSSASDGRLAALVFLFVEFLSLAIIFVMHYGLFLCNLRFVRNQPVALSFLFAGIRQKRARAGAAFFVLPMVACMALFAVIVNYVDFFSLPEFQSPDALMEFVKSNPDSLRKFLACFVLFLALAFVLYFPFTFTWSFVYDKNGQKFWRSLCQSLKFFFGRVFNFLAFEFLCHFKKAFWIFVFDLSHALIYKNYQSSAKIYSFGSLISFVSFALTFYTAAAVILSIQYYYDQFKDENFNGENSK